MPNCHHLTIPLHNWNLNCTFNKCKKLYWYSTAKSLYIFESIWNIKEKFNKNINRNILSTSSEIESSFFVNLIIVEDKKKRLTAGPCALRVNPHRRMRMRAIK